jgi:hypothetical protein
MTELDLARMTLIVGLVIAAFIYHRTRLVSGGLMTPAYLALVISAGSWKDVLGWAILTLASFIVFKIVTYLVALPKAWLLMISIAISTILHGIIVLSTGGKGGHEPVTIGAFSLIISGGMYLTPGLTAFDLSRQGWLRTLGVVVVATGVTLGITLGIAAIGNLSGPAIPLTNPTSNVFTNYSLPVAMIVCVLLAEGMRIGFGWGSGGIIGAIFFVELLDVSSFIVIIVLVAITAIIAHYARRVLTMTPRQWFQFTMILGAVIAWMGLLIGSSLGIDAAKNVGAYALEPLLAVGLISTDVARFGTRHTIYGKVIVLAGVILTNQLVQLGGFDSWIALVGLLFAIIAIYIYAFREVRDGWRVAEDVGSRHPLVVNAKQARRLRR